MGVMTNANFPMDGEGRTYHVGTRRGETANRILTVGDPARAELIAKLLDSSTAPTRVLSKRGFLTITGAYKGTPVSIIAIGMGPSMCDFFVREVRAVVDGPIAIVRFGSCGCIAANGEVGQIAVSSPGAIMVTRNVDYFAGPDKGKGLPYHLSNVVPADEKLSSALVEKLSSSVGADRIIEGLNATADSFYSSQGRIDPSFDDANSDLMDIIIARQPTATTLEMEAFQLLHLAACADSSKPIRAAACMMVFAARRSNNFITPDEVKRLEEIGGRACLDTLIECHL